MTIKEEAYCVATELLTAANLSEEQILVVGCSTSEVIGKRIGSASSVEVAEQIYTGIRQAIDETGKRIFLAVQCCEHLNRALVVERECQRLYALEEVSVVPSLHAGGAFATYAHNACSDPVMVEFITAHAGIDIGATLIGMHMKHVAIPIRPTQKHIGQAFVVAARSRPKLVGGERAKYVSTRRCSS